MSAFPKPAITFHKGQADHTHSVFSILVPSWNNLPYLKLCVESIRRNSLFRHQLIVHVNEGSDGTLEWVRQQGLDHTFSPQNAGVCHAVNASATLATTSYIVYMNDDMYACPGWDAVLLDAIKQNGTKLFYYSGTMIEYEGGTNKAVLAPYDFGRDIASFDEPGLLAFCASGAEKKDWFGSCWPPSIVHADVWRQTGGYSPEFSPGFYSDPDFAMKLWEAGVRDFRGLGKCLVYHFKCKSTGRVRKNDGRKTFMKKWGFASSYLYGKVLLMGHDYDPQVRLRFPKGLPFLFSRLKALLA